MPTRREFLYGGLGALAMGVMPRLRPVPPGLFAPGAAGPGSPANPSFPLAPVPPAPVSIDVDGVPFDVFYTADAYRDLAIPYHTSGALDLPEPEEEVDVVVVGGGISGLSAAWLLRHRNPLVLEFRDRFGGNALGEVWNGVPYSLGSAYIITPDKGSYLEWFYESLGLPEIVRESYPPDPMELHGRILENFWTGEGLPPEEQEALQAYAGVVRYMADEGYPEIPIPNDPRSREWVHELDGMSFRQHVEGEMGMPLTPLLAQGVQTYFHSSFCAGMDEISAASGWNFVAAEEYGRWVFPGGNAAMAAALWKDIKALDETDPAHRPHLRAQARVLDVRLEGNGAVVTYRTGTGPLRAIRARHVVMAGSKHIAKHVLSDLQRLDPDKLDAIRGIDLGAYLVANVLLEAPVPQDFYDLFLLGDGDYPMDAGAFHDTRPVVDVLRGDYYEPNAGGRSVLTLYWPHPYPSARADMLAEGYEPQVQALVPELRRSLEILGLDESAVRQVRLSRWGHAVPVARPQFIAGGDAEKVQRPLGGVIHFVNQDNWALPAIENSILDAARVSTLIDRELSVPR